MTGGLEFLLQDDEFPALIVKSIGNAAIPVPQTHKGQQANGRRQQKRAKYPHGHRSIVLKEFREENDRVPQPRCRQQSEDERKADGGSHTMLIALRFDDPILELPAMTALMRAHQFSQKFNLFLALAHWNELLSRLSF